MARFYRPQLLHVGNTPVIVYPDEGIENLLRSQDSNSIANHLEQVYSQDELTNRGVFNIDILWNDEGSLMTDVWIYSELDNWGSGALVDAKVFRGINRETSIGVSAEYGLIMLGREAEHRMGKTLREYLATRPNLPAELINDKDFFS